MVLLKRILIILSTMLVVASCDPIKRSHRLVRKAIYLNPRIMEKDTLFLRDTVITHFKPFSDTIVIFRGDTIVKDRSIVRTLKMKPDTIIIDGVCPPDTIYLNKVEYVDRVVVDVDDIEKSKDSISEILDKATNLFLVILGIVVVVVIRGLIKGII